MSDERTVRFILIKLLARRYWVYRHISVQTLNPSAINSQIVISISNTFYKSFYARSKTNGSGKTPSITSSIC